MAILFKINKKVILVDLIWSFWEFGMKVGECLENNKLLAYAGSIVTYSELDINVLVHHAFMHSLPNRL